MAQEQVIEAACNISKRLSMYQTIRTPHQKYIESSLLRRCNESGEEVVMVFVVSYGSHE